jgi:hypothetical protein
MAFSTMALTAASHRIGNRKTDLQTQNIKHVESLPSIHRIQWLDFSIDRNGEMAHRWMPKLQARSGASKWLRQANLRVA